MGPSFLIFHLEGASALVPLPEGNLHVGDVLGAVEREGDLALASVGYDFLGARPPRLRVFFANAIVGKIRKATPFSAADVPFTLSRAVVVGAGGYTDGGLAPGLDEVGVVTFICRRGSRLGGGGADDDGEQGGSFVGAGLAGATLDSTEGGLAGEEVAGTVEGLAVGGTTTGSGVVGAAGTGVCNLTGTT